MNIEPDDICQAPHGKPSFRTGNKKPLAVDCSRLYGLHKKAAEQEEKVNWSAEVKAEALQF